MKREFSLVLNTAPHRGGIVPTVHAADAFKACFLLAKVEIGRFRTLLTCIFQCLRFD